MRFRIACQELEGKGPTHVQTIKAKPKPALKECRDAEVLSDHCRTSEKQGTTGRVPPDVPFHFTLLWTETQSQRRPPLLKNPLLLQPQSLF